MDQFSREIEAPTLPIDEHSSKQDIVRLQQWLVVRGFNVGEPPGVAHDTAAAVGIDGSFGAATRAACQAFASASKLADATVDAGEDCWFLGFGIGVRAFPSGPGCSGLRSCAVVRGYPRLIRTLPIPCMREGFDGPGRRSSARRGQPRRRSRRPEASGALWTDGAPCLGVTTRRA